VDDDCADATTGGVSGLELELDDDDDDAIWGTLKALVPLALDEEGPRDHMTLVPYKAKAFSYAILGCVDLRLTERHSY
jgi:hypothetical protein